MMRPLIVALAILAVPALASEAQAPGVKRAGAERAGSEAGVRVFRGGRAEMGQACQPVSRMNGVTVYSGCAPTEASELAGGPSAWRDTVTVTAERAGYCASDIARVEGAAGAAYTVCFKDLQPVYGGRIDDVYRRIKTAAKRACTRSAGYGAALRHAGCEAQAIDLAVYDTALPALIDHHSREIGRRSPVFVGSRR